MPQTGETCQTSGVYQCSSCATTIPLSKGERFPPCGVERKGVTWVLLRPA